MANMLGLKIVFLSSSMAGSNVTDPFVLATYTSTLRGTVPYKSLTGAYASVHQRANKSDEYVTVAAQADAVHILDVSDLHPVISHTLGPSTYFSCPPLTLSTSKSAWTTYAVISSSPELAEADAGRTIYMWKVDSVSKEKHQSKMTKMLFSQEQKIHGVYRCDELKGRIVALSNAGDVTVMDAEVLETKSTWPSSSNGLAVHYAWLFSMAPKNLQTRAFVIVIYSGSSNAHLRILAIDEADSISQVKDEEIELPVEKIISASCNPSGYLSILTTDGHWLLYNLLASLNAAEPTSLLSNRNNSLRLANFSWLSPSPSSSRPPVTTMSLTSSHVLLATTSADEIILLIWDLQFGVLLASYNLPIPSSLSSSPALHLSLAADQENLCRLSPKTEIFPNSPASGQTYLLVSSMLPSRKGSSGAQKERKVTSVVFVVPYTVPRFSTIAAAMGRGSLSQRWLKDERSTFGDEMITKHGKKTAEDATKDKLLLSIRTALQEGRTQAAEVLFLKWASTIQEKEEEMTVFGFNFVQELLTNVLTFPSDPRQRPKSAYAAQIVHHILERGVISSAMLAPHGGLLTLLRAHGDWQSIELAFDKVPDLTEMEIVETLRTVLAHHRSSTQKNKTASESSDAMQVDTESPPSEPQPASDPSTDNSNSMPLGTYLHLMLNYPTTRVPLLLSFRRHLQDPADITILLRMLSDWFVLQRTKSARCRIPGQKDIKKTMEGVWIISERRNAKRKQKPETVPSLEKITSHISTLLDSSFLSLLSYRPSHPILQTILLRIAPEITFIHDAQALRGGLEPFAILQERTLRESLIPKAEKEKENNKVDWRQRKKGVGAATGGADIGVYALEELVL